MEKHNLIKSLVDIGILKSKNIKDALEYVDRIDFVEDEDKKYAYYDHALSIGYDQTISQPLTVVLMLELLDVKKNNIVLDVGSGSGWQSCLLAHMVGKKGFVYSIEIIPELCEMGKNNSSKYPKISKRIRFYCKNAKDGLPQILETSNGFDRIICAAEIREVPKAWVTQLKIGGIMVYPKDRGIYMDIKIAEDEVKSEFIPGFVFVPFVSD